jgi:hypothetical protein
MLAVKFKRPPLPGTRQSGIAGQKSPIVEAAAKTQQGFESM